MFIMELSKFHPEAEVTPMPLQAKLTNLEVLWSPLLKLLKLVGLFHYKENCKWWQNVWKIYSYLVLLFISGMFILFIVGSYPTIAGHNIPLATQIHSIADIFWYTVMLGYTLGLFMTSHQPSKLKAFFQKWLQLGHLHKNVQLQKKIKMQAWNNAAIITFVIIVCCVGKNFFSFYWNIFLYGRCFTIVLFVDGILCN